VSLSGWFLACRNALILEGSKIALEDEGDGIRIP